MVVTISIISLEYTINIVGSREGRSAPSEVRTPNP